MGKASAKTWTRITTGLVGQRDAGKQQRSVGLRRSPRSCNGPFVFHQRRLETSIQSRWAKSSEPDLSLGPHLQISPALGVFAERCCLEAAARLRQTFQIVPIQNHSMLSKQDVHFCRSGGLSLRTELFQVKLAWF